MTNSVDMIQLLHDWKDGDSCAANRLMDALAPQLHYSSSSSGRPVKRANGLISHIDWQQRGDLLVLSSRLAKRCRKFAQ